MRSLSLPIYTMSLRTLFTSRSFLTKPVLYTPLRAQVAHFSGTSLVQEKSDPESYSIEEITGYLKSKSPKQTFQLSIRQPSENSKQGDAAVGYKVTAQTILDSLNDIEDKSSDRFLVQDANEIVYMTKTSVKPKFEVKLHQLTKQESKAGMERKTEWSAKDQKINTTSNKRGSQPVG
ncbi:hypothetical protein K7432_011874 [Basidiobolus ranarum]|uniref:Uncharacterized protein n=1 Tax=Basidiobolus ranarum TaxID=34480 RepID=A0ABR2WLR4_9FUNG